MTELLGRLDALSDPKYKAFNDRLINSKLPTIGIRIPELRAAARDFYGRAEELLASFDGRVPYFEEVAALGIILSRSKIELKRRKELILRWLKYVDSWALTDTAVYRPKAAERGEYLEFLTALTRRSEEFYVRYGAVGLFKYIDEMPEVVLEAYKGISFGAYYVDMAVAWGMCELLIKAYDVGVKAIEDRCFPAFVHNKAIQKAIESYRISDEAKAYLKSLKY